MPHALVHAIKEAPRCPTCGSASGKPCVSKNGIELWSFVHKTRRVVVEHREHNGAELSAYPLARRYEWEPEPEYNDKVILDDGSPRKEQSAAYNGFKQGRALVQGAEA